ncbi:hypothetical protein [Prochlorococcus marinus]|uniref:hypothetical protein n=1 Tax=Prochlorococcus marinus TaxID=1219 RepID=UPI0018C86A9B|nr:hypothetical protein [Prochlorococcus marinus]
MAGSAAGRARSLPGIVSVVAMSKTSPHVRLRATQSSVLIVRAINGMTSKQTSATGCQKKNGAGGIHR